MLKKEEWLLSGRTHVLQGKTLALNVGSPNR